MVARDFRWERIQILCNSIFSHGRWPNKRKEKHISSICNNYKRGPIVGWPFFPAALMCAETWKSFQRAHELCLQHMKGKNEDCKSESERGDVCFPQPLLLDFILAWLTQDWEANGLCSPSDSEWATHFSGHLVCQWWEKNYSTHLVCVLARKHWRTLLFLLYSGQFQVEGYYYHHEEQASHPDAWLNLFINRCSLTMAMWWSGLQPSTTHFPLASRK